MLLETSQFEFFLMYEPDKCMILLENQTFYSYDPNICVVFSHLAEQYGNKNIGNQALRTFLKAKFQKEKNNEGIDRNFLSSKFY